MIDIKNLEAYKENNCVEAKKAKSQLPNSIWETYSAFANTDGGVILLGVEERIDGTLFVTGVDDADKLITDFWNLVNNKNKVNINILTNKMVRKIEVDDRVVIVIEVPRAERSIRPVYMGLDPVTGTYLRFGEGDHLCDREQVSAFYRDAASTTADAKVLKGLDMNVFDKNTLRDYRNYFDGRHPGHVWSKLEDELFLRSIGAMGFDREDGKVYPTVAGILMFGKEYDIVRECPNYFLDYREVMESNIRWTHRLVSSSGEWSGNLFDFFFHVYNRLKKAFPVPFKLDSEGARIDDMPMHKAIREMVTNTLAHADYYGRQGIVIIMKPDFMSFANPGDMRTGLKLALSGGTSDARNSSIMKMFSLLDFGERAGSGIPDLFDVCKIELNDEPQYEITYNPARTTMKINTSFYQSTQKTDESTQKTDESTQKTDESTQKTDESTQKTDESTQKMILNFLSAKPKASRTDLARAIGISEDGIKKQLAKLKAKGYIERIGPDKGGWWKILK